MKFTITAKTAFAAASLTVLAGSSAALAACNDPPSSRYAVKGAVAYDATADLSWQRCSVGQTFKNGACDGLPKKMPWADAMKQAKDGWRVATKEELLTLVSPTCKAPAINTDVFPDKEDQTHWYWSSTEYGGPYAAYVGFTGGGTYNGERVTSYAVRLVKKGK